jgi:hypothetical protein
MTPYRYNVGQFKRDHPGHVLSAGAGGFGFEVQAKDGRGRGVGERISAPTLDKLATKLRRQRQGSRREKAAGS